MHVLHHEFMTARTIVTCGRSSGAAEPAHGELFCVAISGPIMMLFMLPAYNILSYDYIDLYICR
jgi:hypothetical protein